MRCPGYRERATLDPGGHNENDVAFNGPDGVFFAGQRLCPSQECRTHLFVLYRLTEHGPELLAAYPPERVDFDAGNLPPLVLAAFEEAVTCHAHECWAAAAMMVRKTLEALCTDREARGENLNQRLKALKEQATLPPSLLRGLDALRLLGNDAAHIESRDYEQVGKEEVEIAVEVTKEILKATYQMESIVDRLRSLQREQGAEGA